MGIGYYEVQHKCLINNEAVKVPLNCYGTIAGLHFLLSIDDRMFKENTNGRSAPRRIVDMYHVLSQPKDQR